LVKGIEVIALPLIKKAIEEVSDEKIRKCVAKGLSYIDEKF
jgi:hypothetical protein